MQVKVVLSNDGGGLDRITVQADTLGEVERGIADAVIQMALQGLRAGDTIRIIREED